jgi:hypothetical protein
MSGLFKAKPRKIPATNEIVAFFHCMKCLDEKPDGTSPREWAQLEVGFTPIGLQVWCKRHELNILHIDFEGLKHPANMGTVKPRKGKCKVQP